MSVATHDLTHAADANANVIGFLRNKANLSALINVYAAEIQAVEDALWQELTQRDLLSAVGMQLDNLGDILVLARAGLSDADYRVQLQAKISLNISSGLINDILTLFALLTPGVTYSIRQVYPASFILIANAPVSVPVATLGSILQSATAAGVNSQLRYSTVPSSTTFTVSDSNLGLVASTSLGFADSNSPGTGGHYAGSA